MTASHTLAYLWGHNWRLRRFLAAAERHGLTVEPADEVANCVLVGRGHDLANPFDYLVLYPGDRTPSLTVYTNTPTFEKVTIRAGYAWLLAHRTPDARP